MAHVRLEGITKKFGSHAAVSDLNLEIADGQFFVLLGPKVPARPRRFG